MNMPTPCPECGDVFELDDMKNIGNELYCDECHGNFERDDK